MAPIERVAIRDGRFILADTGRPFVPLGVNYCRVGDLGDGKPGHATFAPRFYDQAFVERMLADIAARGLNTVRTFHIYYVGAEGILLSPEAREISPAYLSNVVHFLREARQHGIHVIFTWDIWLPSSEWWSSTPLPDEERYDLRPEWDQSMGINNIRLCLPAVRTRANAIVALIEGVKQIAPDLLSVVLAWELENEICFAADQMPFSARARTFRFAGRDYDLSSDDEKQALMDAVTVQWVDCCARAIRRADPKALVSADVYAFAAVGRLGPGSLSRDTTADTRVPARPLALVRSSVDYVDIHLYAWRSDSESQGESFARMLASDEWDTLRVEASRLGKPILCGECGVAAHYLRKPDGAIDHAMGVECLAKHVRNIRDAGFAGALYWHYGNPDSTPDEEQPPMVLFPQYGDALRALWP